MNTILKSFKFLNLLFQQNRSHLLWQGSMGWEELRRLQCQIFKTIDYKKYNPENKRTGEKYLLKLLKGPSLVHYHPLAADKAVERMRFTTENFKAPQENAMKEEILHEIMGDLNNNAYENLPCGLEETYKWNKRQSLVLLGKYKNKNWAKELVEGEEETEEEGKKKKKKKK